MKSLTVRFLLLTGAVFCAAGCGQPGAAHEGEGSGGQPPIRVTVTKPERKTLVRTVDLPGRVEAFEVAPLYSKVTGYVVNISVDIGDRIKGPKDGQPGAPLCELLVPELHEDLAEKDASVAQIKAEVLQSNAGVKVAEAAVRSVAARVHEAQTMMAREEARFNRWQSEYERISQLATKGVLTQKVADETREQLDGADAGRKEVSAKIATAEAARLEAIASVEKAKADAAATQSHLAVAEAEQRRVKAMLDYCVIRAPFDGVVVERTVHTGHLVQAGGANGHAPVLTVMRIDPVRVLVDVPETDAVYIDKGTKVELKIPSLPGAPWTGTVTRTSWSLNTTSRTLTAEIDVSNADGRLRPGLYVQAKLTVAELKDKLSLPKAAIVTQEKQTYCFSVEPDGTVKRRAISVGLQAGTDFEIRDGLSGGENVISVNANSFRDGQVVEIASPGQPSK